MTRADLLGAHTHTAGNDVQVHIWLRDGKYLARGSYSGRRFGVTLGNSALDAATALRRLLVEIDDGTFLSGAERRQRRVERRPVQRCSVRHLIDRYLAEVRKRRGRDTARTYSARLMPTIEYAELPANAKRWRTASEINRDFAVGFRAWLHSRTATANGHAMARSRPISARQIYNILSGVSTTLNWAKNPGVALLPAEHVNPFSRELVGERPRRDPLAAPVISLADRIAMVSYMDAWQLSHLALSLVLPNRPDEWCGLTIDNVDTSVRTIRFQARDDGANATKAGVAFQTIYPKGLDVVFKALIGSRSAGPLFRSRRAWSDEGLNLDVEELFRDSLLDEAASIQSAGDRKRLFRSALQHAGGTNAQTLRREFQSVWRLSQGSKSVRFYDLRAAVTTDLARAGVDYLTRMYVTGHSIKREILAEYQTFDIGTEMAKYFEYIGSLLGVIEQRAQKLLT